MGGNRNIEKHREQGRKDQARYSKTEKGRLVHVSSCEKYRKRYPERIKACNILGWAVNSGKIQRPSHCSQCGNEEKTHGHHHNGYENDLDVVWLCGICHKKEHALNEC